MAKEIGGGKLDIFVDDYAYAEDGIRVWNAILKFAQNYLKLYYDDNKKGKRVRQFSTKIAKGNFEYKL